jgi:RimJ/RimL family protein N-acetyltransferase
MLHDSAPLIETERLILRPLTLEDFEAYAAAWADPQMTAFIGGTPRDRTTSWAKFTAAAGMWPVVGYGYWTFIDRKSGTFIGNGGLARLERGLTELDGYPEAGWAFIPATWGKGLATEAMAAVLEWADEVLRGAEIRCIIDPGNMASERVSEKLGFAKLAEVDFPPGKTIVYRRESPLSE